jgi:type III secretion protein R
VLEGEAPEVDAREASPSGDATDSGEASRSRSAIASAGALVALAVTALPAAAAAQGAAATSGPPVASFLALGLLALVPFAFMTMTSFTKIAVVFSILRNALGTGQVPSGAVITSLAALLSFYVMAPVGEAMWADAAPAAARIDRERPFEGESADAVFEAVELGAAPLRRFLERHAGRRELALFLDLARRARPPATRAEVTAHDLLVVMPAFLITELTEAFQIGFLVFIPFLVIDMVVANVLLSLGMHMLSPTTVSLPFKLLLFVMVDGFYLLSRSLLLGYV